MVELTQTNRKSAVLKPSSLACLSRIPTINLTSGCAHGCLYCYARGYRTHPGGDRVIIYRNTLTKLESELAHKRGRPSVVYFSPSSDVFQPVPEVLKLGHSILEFLLERGIGVAFVTKGIVPHETMRLLLRYPSKVGAQIGIISVDERVRSIFEPGAASFRTRLEQMAEMIAGHIATEARVVPILPGCTDDPQSLQQLMKAIAQTGVKRVAVSALFLRPAIASSLEQGIPDYEILGKLLGAYGGSGRLAVRAERSSITPLPRTRREALFELVARVAEEFGLEVSVCACMNPDISTGTCNIRGERQAGDIQPSLFGLEA